MLKFRSLIIIFLLGLTVFSLNAQSTSNIVVLLQGKTLDKDANPIKVKLTFTDKQTHKKTITVSNKNGGLYQVVLKPGHKYDVSFKGFLSADSATVVEIPDFKKYSEMSQTFTLNKIKEGLLLCNFNAFKPNDTLLTGVYKEYFAGMKQFLRNNINARVVITVSMNDSYFKKRRVKRYYKDKRGRRRYKRVWLKADEQLQKVLQARLLAIQNYVDSLKLRPSMLSYKTQDKMGKKPKKKKRRRRKKHKHKKKNTTPPTPPINNVKIEVGKMMKI